MFIALFVLLSFAQGAALAYFLGYAGLFISVPVAIVLGIVGGTLEAERNR